VSAVLFVEIPLKEALSFLNQDWLFSSAPFSFFVVFPLSFFGFCHDYQNRFYAETVKGLPGFPSCSLVRLPSCRGFDSMPPNLTGPISLAPFGIRPDMGQFIALLDALFAVSEKQ